MQIATSLTGESEALSIALQLIRYFEGCYLKPYLCPAGVATIGFGSTLYEDGTRVTLKDPPITKERALEILVVTVRRDYLPVVIKMCPTLRSPEQRAAILSWVYNLGSGRLWASTMRKKILASAWSDVPAEIRKWDKAGGKRLNGLTKRRDSEAVLFILG